MPYHDKILLEKGSFWHQRRNTNGRKSLLFLIHERWRKQMNCSINGNKERKKVFCPYYYSVPQQLVTSLFSLLTCNDIEVWISLNSHYTVLGNVNMYCSCKINTYSSHLRVKNSKNQISTWNKTCNDSAE